MMRFSTLLLLAVTVGNTPELFGQSNGYVGVFGDAAGTIRCIEAPPFVPTTLYVLAITDGSTASGIAGAEFQIQIDDPTGYLLIYASPEGSLPLGDPLSAVGFTIAFPVCQVPTTGIVSLGTITVVNTGSGGLTGITVKRRNPSTNPNYQCALFIQCDVPVFTKSCMTAPQDSASCLTQKANSYVGVPHPDEFTSSLEGSQTAAARSWVGYNIFDSSGYEGLISVIETKNPTVGLQVAAWGGMDNGFDPAVGWIWLQSGWEKSAIDTEAQMYWEYTNDVGVYSNINNTGIAPAGGVVYRVRKNGNKAELITNGVVESPSGLAWTDFDATLLIKTQFGSESFSVSDHTPGSKSNPCDFSSIELTKAGGGKITPSFSPKNRVCTHPINGRAKSTTAGSFFIGDKRDP